MKIRAALHLNGREQVLQLYQGLQETDEHMVLKLAGAIFFFDREVSAEMGATHPALAGQEYWPDLLAADLTNQVTLWVECGKTTVHKLEKASRRFRGARIVILTALPHQARQQMEEVRAADLKGIEAWSFREGEFKRWSALVQERSDVIGESSETGMNLVINNETFETELQRAE
jgi:uncharacterized protein YaeQ